MMSGAKVSLLVRALIPIFALAIMVWLFVAKGRELTAPIQQNVQNLPVPEKLDIERIVFKPAQIIAYVRNSGPQEVTIADVHLNDMAVQAYIHPTNTIPRLGRAVVVIPHDWVEGDPYEVRLVTSTGLFHSRTVKVAALTPTPNWKYFAVFALLGLYVGVIPVYLGLVWFPFLRRLKEQWMNFLLAFTVGLLIFLGVDAIEDALEVTERIAEPFQPKMLILIGVVGSFLGLIAVSEWLRGIGKAKSEGFVRLMLAYMIATGIGLHNLGEGLAIGAAYTLGEVALGALLVIGFAIHNTTEGIAIVAPITKTGASLPHLAFMGFIAGVPTILGTWIGGFTYSDVWSVIFLSVGAGAIFQVVYAIVKHTDKEPLRALGTGHALAGLLGGFMVMYLTGLMVS